MIYGLAGHLVDHSNQEAADEQASARLATQLDILYDFGLQQTRPAHFRSVSRPLMLNPDTIFRTLEEFQNIQESVTNFFNVAPSWIIVWHVL